MSLPPPPGPGAYDLPLATPAFYLLVGLLALFIGMLWLLRRRYPRRERGLDGYFDAAGVDLAFLVFALLLVVGLAWHDPRGNRTALALYRVVLSGYWLTFSIPLVTVGTSIQDRSRGGIPWLVPSVLAAGALFVVLFAYFFANP